MLGAQHEPGEIPAGERDDFRVPARKLLTG